jgi:gamma-glutamyl-gamma-aminobutyrate hydrolase PuuD
MQKPIILTTVGRQPQATPEGELQLIKTGCDINYIEAIARAGGAPVILPCFDDKDAIRAIVRTADGILLTGGGDVVSLAYGAEPHIKSKGQDPVRDEMEIEVTRLAIEMELPILGICRGVQLLNVVLGGTLLQDIPSEVPDAVKHYSEGAHTVLLHNVDIEEDSLLARILKTDSMAINTWHHQAVKDLGRGLRVNCRARDGVIEGVEAADGRPILGVQWHPEEAAATYPRFQTFFDWIVREANANSSRKQRRGETDGHLASELHPHHHRIGAPALPEVTEGLADH